MTGGPLLAVKPKQTLLYFDRILRLAGIEHVDQIIAAAVAQVQYHQGKADGSARDPVRELEATWYASLPDEPAYEVYDSDWYLTDLWACWIVYSRRYLIEITKSRSLPPDGLVATLGTINRVADLGCGFGFTSAALSEIFPSAEVTGTNLPDTTQTRIALAVAERSRFEIQYELDAVGPADLVFASEYFEHFHEPVTHLRDVIDALQPRALIIANAFNADAIGHFDEYLIDETLVPGRETTAAFNRELVRLGFVKVHTNMWNSRPAFWTR